MDKTFNFFTSGNTRNLGMNCTDESWQQCLHKIDLFIHTSNPLSLASQDIVFQKDKDQYKVAREITGFVSDHELASLDLFVDDAVNRCCAATGLGLAYDTGLNEVLAKASQAVLDLQGIDFPKNYGEFSHFEVRLRMNFKTIDELKTDWLAYMFFDRTSSSILTF